MELSTLLEQYEPYVGHELLQRIYRAAEALAGVHILHLNTTAVGGGVAEILEALTPLAEEFGIHHSRKIVQLDIDSNRFTTRLVDFLQGNEPGKLPEDEKQAFLDKMRHAALTREECQADVYFIHDFQLAPLAQLYPWMRPALWFCHIDTANPNPDAQHYLRQFLDAYQLCLFNTRLSIFHDIPAEKAQVITLGINPFNPKNGPLSKEQGMAALVRCGLDTERPLITQVARFDRWKNPWQAVDIYRQVKQSIPSVQLALVGAMEASDDINARTILHDIQGYSQGDKDIHLLYDPEIIQDEEVNALQRYSDVILQRSTHEGFGLTTTEAMWKEQPVVGTTATGLRTQIIHGVNGYTVDDTATAAACTLDLLQQRDLWRQMGWHAHTHVQQHYLLPMMIRDYLEALGSVVSRKAA